MEKNINLKSEYTNLLNTKEFQSRLKFEAEYATLIKGGHSPKYYGKEKTKRLVNEVNILSSKEKQELVYNLFISKN